MYGEQWPLLQRAGKQRLDGVRLLFRHIANYRKLEHLPLVGLHEQKDPQDKFRQTNQRPDQEAHCPSEEGNVPENLQRNPEDEQSNAEENTLKRVKPDKAPLVIGLKHQKQKMEAMRIWSLTKIR